MHSLPGSLQPPGPLNSQGAGRPWLRRWTLPNQLQLPPQLRQQFVSLTSCTHSPSRCAARQCSPTWGTERAAIAAAAAATGTLLSNDGRPRQPPLRPLARLHSASSKVQRHQRGLCRRRRDHTQLCAAAAVLQPPVAGETLTQLAARFMARTLLLSCSVCRLRRAPLPCPQVGMAACRHDHPGASPLVSIRKSKVQDILMIGDAVNSCCRGMASWSAPASAAHRRSRASSRPAARAASR